MNCYLYVNSSKLSINHIAAVNEYAKRLSPYCLVRIIAEKNITLPKDIYKPDHRLLIVRKGKSTHSSTELADYINKLQINGISSLHIAFGINEYFETSDIIAITPSDLSTDTVVLLFMEQLYRSYTIITGKTYHK